ITQVNYLRQSVKSFSQAEATPRQKLPSQHGSATCWPSPRTRRSGRSTSVVASSSSSSRLHRTNFQRLREYPGATCERGESMRKRAITGELAFARPREGDGAG